MVCVLDMYLAEKPYKCVFLILFCFTTIDYWKFLPFFYKDIIYCFVFQLMLSTRSHFGSVLAPRNMVHVTSRNKHKANFQVIQYSNERARVDSQLYVVEECGRRRCHTEPAPASLSSRLVYRVKLYDRGLSQRKHMSAYTKLHNSITWSLLVNVLAIHRARRIEFESSKSKRCFQSNIY